MEATISYVYEMHVDIIQIIDTLHMKNIIHFYLRVNIWIFLTSFVMSQNSYTLRAHMSEQIQIQLNPINKFSMKTPKILT